MPLTRHWYEQDEVQAALFYSGSRHRPQETVFWCNELVLSGWGSEAIRILFECWIWNYAPFHGEWYEEAWKRLSPAEITTDDILYCAHSLSLGIKDHSLWKLLTLSAVDHAALYDAVTPRSPASFPSDNPQEMFFVRALFQRKATSAWWVACYLPVSRFWELLEWYRITLSPCHTGWETLRSYEALLGYTSEGYDRVIRAVALLSLCLPRGHNGAMGGKGWVSPASVGRRADRLYSIPLECLYGTVRGRLGRGETTIGGLNDVESGMQGCPFWEEAMEPYQTDGRWTSEDAHETFYRRYFPDDLPDEWTRAEKEKSHGPGLRGTEPLTLAGYGRRLFFCTARLVWSRSRDVPGALSETPLDDVAAMEPVLSPVEVDKYRPVHKRPVAAA